MTMTPQETNNLALYTTQQIEKLDNEELEDMIEILQGIPQVNARLALLAGAVHFTLTIDGGSEETFQNMLKSLLACVPTSQDVRKELTTAQPSEA